VIAPGEWLGLLGGGQLGRMFCHAAQAMGYRVVVLDPAAEGPAADVADQHIQSDYDDKVGLIKLAEHARAVTTEFENVPADSLAFLKSQLRVTPGAHAVEVVQDRIAEKTFIAGLGVAVAPHRAVRGVADLNEAPASLFPGILKVARLGYDGKGQIRVKTREDLIAAWTQLGQVPCVLEKMLPLALECSVIVARSRSGQVVNFPVQRNLHRDGILAVTEVYEGNLSAQTAQQAVSGARAIAAGLDYVGVLCVEFFVLADGSLVVNEIAPRPHNSGHYTLDGCDVSQFELQVRTLCGLPLTTPRLHSPSFMLNLLGDLWPIHAPTAGPLNAAPPWEKVLALPGTHLHLYGKQEAKPGRKMGHLNITAKTPEEARQVALQAAACLGIPAF